jgi:hypothetical protein
VNNQLSAIRSALNTKLSALTTLKQVAIGRSIEPSGFPFCRFYLSGIENELKDNTPSNWRTYRFAVEVIQETTVKDIAVAEAAFEDAVDAVLDTLNSQWTLSGNVDVSSVDSATIAVIDGPQGPVLIASISLSARTLIA